MRCDILTPIPPAWLSGTVGRRLRGHVVLPGVRAGQVPPATLRELVRGEFWPFMPRRPHRRVHAHWNRGACCPSPPFRLDRRCARCTGRLVVPAELPSPATSCRWPTPPGRPLRLTGATTRLAFRDISSSGPSSDGVFDNVIVTGPAAIPEPASFALLCLGLAGLGRTQPSQELVIKDALAQTPLRRGLSSFGARLQLAFDLQRARFPVPAAEGVRHETGRISGEHTPCVTRYGNRGPP
jgi:hypothetical protein